MLLAIEKLYSHQRPLALQSESPVMVHWCWPRFTFRREVSVVLLMNISKVHLNVPLLWNRNGGLTNQTNAHFFLYSFYC